MLLRKASMVLYLKTLQKFNTKLYLIKQTVRSLHNRLWMIKQEKTSKNNNSNSTFKKKNMI